MTAVYLLHAAFDVAIAEAVIGITLSTVLYLVAMRKEDDVCLLSDNAYGSKGRSSEQVSLGRQLIAALFLILLAGGVLFADHQPEARLTQDGTVDFLNRFQADTVADNAETAIHLNYRLFDPPFETLTLHVIVMGIICFSRHKLAFVSGTLHEDLNDKHITILPSHREVLAEQITRILYPLIRLLGCAVVLRGGS